MGPAPDQPPKPDGAAGLPLLGYSNEAMCVWEVGSQVISAEQQRGRSYRRVGNYPPRAFGRTFPQFLDHTSPGDEHTWRSSPIYDATYPLRGDGCMILFLFHFLHLMRATSARRCARSSLRWLACGGWGLVACLGNVGIRPNTMEHFPAWLVNSLICVRTEVIALGLHQISRQARTAVLVEIRQ